MINVPFDGRVLIPTTTSAQRAPLTTQQLVVEGGDITALSTNTSTIYIGTGMVDDRAGDERGSKPLDPGETFTLPGRVRLSDWWIAGDAGEGVHFLTWVLEDE